MRRMKLAKGLDISNITFGPRRRVQSIEGVLSLLSTSKDLLKPFENNKNQPLIKKKIEKFKEKLAKAQLQKKPNLTKKIGKKFITKKNSQKTPQTADLKEEISMKNALIQKKEGIITKFSKDVNEKKNNHSRISKKLRRVHLQN